MKVLVEVDTKRCTLCKLCVEYCPAGVFVLQEGVVEADSSKCIECYGCIPLCPARAISVKTIISGLRAFSKTSNKV